MNVTDFSKSDDGDAKGKASYQLGGSVMFGKRKLYVEPGIFYTAKSTKFTYSNSSGTQSNPGNQEIDAKFNGFRIPVAVGLRLLGPVGLRVFGGGSVFFITSTKDVKKDSINTTNWAAFAGAGLDFWKLFVDLSYEWSMTDVQKDASKTDMGQARTFYIAAGIRIGL